MEKAPYESPSQSFFETIPEIEDVDDAREYISEMLEHGERPIVTVPKRYEMALSQGLKPHTTWIDGLDIIAGTLGRPPYLPGGEERIMVKIKSVQQEQIQPRFTGNPAKFRGVVVITGPVTPENLEVAAY